jgi:hypothetical protein
MSSVWYLREPLFTDALSAGHGCDVDYSTLFRTLLGFSGMGSFGTLPCASTVVCHGEEPTAGYPFRIDSLEEVP